METLVVCTSVYPAGLQYWDAYCRGLNDAVSRFIGSVHLVLACDGVESADLQRGIDVLKGVPLSICTVAESTTVAGVRRAMLCSAASMEKDAVICFDMDDVPNADGLSLHVEALRDADISYGDMQVINSQGVEVLPSYFCDRNVPGRFHSVDPLLNRNFMGFTNTAVRSGLIPSVAGRIPDDVHFVDWWFFSNLMVSGHTAEQTSGAVVGYRAHGQNMVGGRPATDLPNLRKRCMGVLAHYERMPGAVAPRSRSPGVHHLLRLIEQEPKRVSNALKQLPTHLLWHEDVVILASRFGGEL